MGKKKVRGKWIEHYSSKHEMLLVGEGDFSFAACLAEAFGNACNMVATSLDSKEMLGIKHSSAAANLDLLEEKGCTILHKVDACAMSHHRILRYMKFDRIVFNFPHAGFTKREHDPDQISLHQSLVGGFLQNAYEMVAESGEVHITHKTAYPFCEWEIEQLGREAGFVFRDAALFFRENYPGYINKRGSGRHSNRTFPVAHSSTFKFAKP